MMPYSFEPKRSPLGSSVSLFGESPGRLTVPSAECPYEGGCIGVATQVGDFVNTAIGV